MKRRNMLIATGGLAVAAASGVRATASEDDDLVSFLFVQTAPSVRLSGGKLTLSGISASTLYFSDRPERIAGHVTTAEFVDHWASGSDSFKADPPNGVLSLHQSDDPTLVVVVLKEPRMEGADLVYDVDVLDGPDDVSGSTSSLFIDEIGKPLTPISFAGANRRNRRRNRRAN